jgi:hypothetical protein
METTPHKNQITVNGKATKAENVFNQLYQNQIALYLGYRLRLNLYNLANLNPDSTYQAKFITPENTKENQNGCQQNR